MTLGVVMVGATITVILHPGNLGWGTPALHLVLLTMVALARWRERFGS